MSTTGAWVRVRNGNSIGRIAALGAGAGFPFGFAPFGLWPVALAALLVLSWTIQGGAGRLEAVARCFLFGVGKFAVGAYWIFVSLDVYADIPTALSVGLFLAFVAIAAAVFALLGCFAAPSRWAFLDAVVFASGLCVVEVSLSMPWALSFPWLHLGYALVDTPLSVFARWGGVWAVGFAGALTAVAVGQAVRRRWTTLCVAAALWVPGLVFERNEPETGEALAVALVQGNVPLERKWGDGSWQSLFERYAGLSDGAGDADLIVWPESAVPVDLRGIEREVAESAQPYDGRLVFGALETNAAQGSSATFNVVAVLEDGDLAFFRKERLVPFGEYIPLPGLLDGALRTFGYPMSSLASSVGRQAPLQLGGRTLAAAICYEVAYPQLIRRRASGADLIVVVSEDSWLGDTTGPWQHLEIARMRALELDRYLLRATNDGVTAIIDSTGSVVEVLPRYRADVLLGSVVPKQTDTAYSRFGLVPMAVVVLLVMIADWLARAFGRVHDARS